MCLTHHVRWNDSGTLSGRFLQCLCVLGVQHVWASSLRNNLVSLRHRLYCWRTKDVMSSNNRWISHRFNPFWKIAERCCTYSPIFALRPRHVTERLSPKMFLGQITSARRLWQTTRLVDIKFNTKEMHFPIQERGQPTMTTYSWLMAWVDLLSI